MYNAIKLKQHDDTTWSWAILDPSHKILADGTGCPTQEVALANAKWRS